MGSGNPAALPGNIAEKTKTFAEKLKQTKVTSKMQVHNNYSANERYGINSIERIGKVEYIKTLYCQKLIRQNKNTIGLQFFNHCTNKILGLTSSESTELGQANTNCGSKDIIKTNPRLAFHNRNIQNYDDVDNSSAIVHDQSKDPDKLPAIPKKELTEEELELMREKRRERRKREKEKKKMLKEQKKRAEVYAPKSSKINVVSADTLLRRYVNGALLVFGSQPLTRSTGLYCNLVQLLFTVV